MDKSPIIFTQTVKTYYDRNTKFFLPISKRKDYNVHRAVWAEGVQNSVQAHNYINQLILNALQLINSNFQTIHILDLGCGFGSTLFYLAKNFSKNPSYTGVTISTQQVMIAREINQRLDMPCQFVEADFLNLPDMSPVHFAYAIEAFIHAPDPQAFFNEVGRILLPGGRLVLIDDFLTEKGNNSSLSPKHQQWMEDVKTGWMAGSLVTPNQAATFAQKVGLKLIENKNFTSYLKLRRLKDKLISFFLLFAGSTAKNSTYIRSLLGGDALQKCLLNGLLEFRVLIFEKTK